MEGRQLGRRQGVVTPSVGARQLFCSTLRIQFGTEARPDEDVAETCGQRPGEQQLARRTATPRARTKASWKRSSMLASFM